jgi:hypothetical protein
MCQRKATVAYFVSDNHIIETNAQKVICNNTCTFQWRTQQYFQPQNYVLFYSTVKLWVFSFSIYKMKLTMFSMLCHFQNEDLSTLLHLLDSPTVLNILHLHYKMIMRNGWIAETAIFVWRKNGVYLITQEDKNRKKFIWMQFKESLRTGSWGGYSYQLQRK